MSENNTCICKLHLSKFYKIAHFTVTGGKELFSNFLVEGMSCFQAIIKREIRKFQVVQVQRRQRIVQKSVMHLPKLLFCESQPITFLTFSFLPPSSLLMLSSRLHNAAVELGTWEASLQTVWTNDSPRESVVLQHSLTDVGHWGQGVNHPSVDQSIQHRTL